VLCAAEPVLSSLPSPVLALLPPSFLLGSPSSCSAGSPSRNCSPLIRAVAGLHRFTIFPSLLILYTARAGEVAFRIRVPRVSEDLRKVWRDFLSSYAKALKAKHGLPITVEDIEGEDWVEIVVRTV